MTNRKILISQQAPSNVAAYSAITEKYGVEIEFKPFFMIEPLNAKEFRTQRINIPEYTAIVFSSRHGINAFFGLCEELRVKVPDTLKYFCTTEVVAMYLQKHIVYRKRKIFFGNGTPESIIEQIGSKHKGEKFLIVSSAGSNTDHMTGLFEEKGLDHTTGIFVKSVPQDLSGVDFSSYEAMVLYNPKDLSSLFGSQPEFKQGDLKIIAYGKSIVRSLEEANLEIELQAPTPEAPSAAKAIELYLSKNR